MKLEYYASKAQRDVSFRQRQLEEMVYQKKLNQVGFVLIGVASGSYVAYCGIFQHRCPNLGETFFVLLLCTWRYTYARTKVTALQSINQAGNGREQERLLP